MSIESNDEYFTANINDAESALRIANGVDEEPKWMITEFGRGLVTHYCLTRADGSTDDRATNADIWGTTVRH